MSIKLVDIKRVYELLSSWPRDQTDITSISRTGKQMIYQLCHLGINIHFKNHCHQLLLFMTEAGERTLEEVLVSVLFSQGTVMPGTPVITGTSQFLQWWWVKLKKILQMNGVWCLHDKCVPFRLLLQGYLLQHEGLNFKGCLLFQLNQQILKCRSLSLVENNQQLVCQHV